MTDDRTIQDGDDALLTELAAVLRADHAPPPQVMESARATFTWRTIDAEIAALSYDSLLDDELAGVRAGYAPRILSFDADGRLTVEIEVDDSGRRLLGQLVPAQAGTLELRDGTEVLVSTEADDLGRFTASLPSRTRRLTLRCRLRDGSVVDTAAAEL